MHSYKRGKATYPVSADIQATLPVRIRTVNPVEMRPWLCFLSRCAAEASVLTQPVRHAFIRCRAVYNIAARWVRPLRLAACVVERGARYGRTARSSFVLVRGAVGEEAGGRAGRERR